MARLRRGRRAVPGSARGVVVTGEEWDTHRDSIFDDLLGQTDETEDLADRALVARMLADRECTEQFGDRPQDTKEQTA